MVCVPCIVIPALLWIFHNFIYPFIQKFWKPVADTEGKTPEFTKEQLETDEGKLVQKLIKENPVVIFSKTTCSYCSMSKRVFNENGITFEDIQLDTRDDMDKLQDLFLAITGARTVPRVFIGGKCMGGGTEVMNLNSAGKLVSLVEAAGGSIKKEN